MPRALDAETARAQARPQRPVVEPSCEIAGGADIGSLGGCDAVLVFERFTERSRQVVVHAQEAARQLRHDNVGTGHLLVGLLAEREGIAARVLTSAGITEEGVRAEVVRTLREGEVTPAGTLQFTPGLIEVIARARREGLALGHNYVGTEHLLLAVLHGQDGAAAEVLGAFDADVASGLRDEVMRALSGTAPGWRPAPRTREPGDIVINPGWFDGTDALLDDLTAEIRSELRREPDSGDLLIALSCVSESLLARILPELGVDADLLAQAVGSARAADERRDVIEDTRQRKEVALEAQQFELAHALRDEERRLTHALRARQDDERDLIRQRLSLPGAAGPHSARRPDQSCTAELSG